MTAQGIIASCSTGPLMVAPPALLGEGPPLATLQGILGQNYIDKTTSPRTVYVFTGREWITDASSTTDVNSVTGTANQILATPTTGDVVLSLIGPYSPTSFTDHGVLIGNVSGAIQVTTAGTAGQFLVSGGAGADPTWSSATFPATVGAVGTIIRSDGTNWIASTDTWPDTVAAGDILMASASNVVGVLADVAAGQVLMSGGGGNPAYTGSPSVSGSLTAATTITATLGAITATNGNIVLGTAGNKQIYTSVATNTATAGANSAGTVTLIGGTITVTTTEVTASSLIRLTRQSVGATGANDLGILSVGTIVAATSFIINAWTVTNATVLQADDVSIIFWEIVN